MIESVTIHGLDALSAALRELPKRIARNVLRGATSAGAAVIRNEARLRAPVYTGPVSEGHPPSGTLKRSIVQKQIQELSDLTRQTFYVTVRKGKKYRNQGKKKNLSQDAFYASWVEFGHFAGGSFGGSNMTKRQQRQARAAGTAQGSRFVVGHPFMRPAWEAKKNDAARAIAAYLETRIPRELESLPK